jgi:3-hydroxyisobutyrate dehydrogenase-like beta-hydroxyacid dehydrogenase
VADAAEVRRLNYVRCPVSGNPRALASGEVTLIVSGDETSVRAARPVLSEMSSQLYNVGAKEEARVLKLAVNSMLAANAEMLAELVTLSEALGIDRSVLLEVLGGSAVGTPFVRYKRAALVQRLLCRCRSSGWFHSWSRPVVKRGLGSWTSLPCCHIFRGWPASRPMSPCHLPPA